MQKILGKFQGDVQMVVGDAEDTRNAVSLEVMEQRMSLLGRSKCFRKV